MQDKQKIIEKLDDKALEKDEHVENLIRITSALYDKASAYTNIVIAAGFVGFFTVWGNMKDHLSIVQMSTSAFSITLSLTVFILWEVYMMWIRSKSINERHTVIKAPPAEFKVALEKQEKSEQLRNIQTHKIWRFALFFTVVPGIVAAGILIYSFTKQLWTTIIGAIC